MEMDIFSVFPVLSLSTSLFFFFILLVYIAAFTEASPSITKILGISHYRFDTNTGIVCLSVIVGDAAGICIFIVHIYEPALHVQTACRWYTFYFRWVTQRCKK